MKDFSRRRLLKIGASLFAFVPAINYLMSSPKAFAFVPCDDPEFIECVYYETECANYDCELQDHWYTVEECSDARNNEICYYTYTNTGETC